MTPASAAAEPVQGCAGIAIGRTECEVARAAGAPGQCRDSGRARPAYDRADLCARTAPWNLSLRRRTHDVDGARCRAGAAAALRSASGRNARADRSRPARGLRSVSLSRFERSAGRQPILFGALQGLGRGAARLAELRGLRRLARKDIRQRERCVDLGDDAVDALDLRLGVGDLLPQRLPALAAFVARRSAVCALSSRSRCGRAQTRAPTAPRGDSRRDRRRRA